MPKPAPKKKPASTHKETDASRALVALETKPQAAEDFYKRLRQRIRRWLAGPEGKSAQWAEIVMFGPDLFHLVVKLALDPQVTLANRARLAATVGYFMSPIDIIPELLTGPLGFLDDIALAAYVLHRLINTSDKEIVLRHWAGEGDLLKVLKQILASANDMLGAFVAARIQRLARFWPRGSAKV